MDPLSATASVIAILQLSSKVLGYLNAVKDASKDHEKCTREAANLYSLLTALRFHLEEKNSRDPWYTAVRALAVENGPLDQFKQALEQLQTKLTGTGRLGAAGNVLIWKFKKEEIASILGRMERLKTLVEIALQMDHFKIEMMKTDTGFIRTQIPAMQYGLDSIQSDQDRIRYDKLITWLSSLDFPAQQTDIISRRQEGTGRWFLDAPELARWLQEPKGILFCPGIPGAGKTMIAAIAIDHLLKTVQSTSIGVAYVYCSYKAQGEQSVASLLAAILKQLVQARPSYAEPVEQLHELHRKSGTKPTADDGNDGNRRRFLDLLRSLQADNDMRLMATSRYIPEITDDFREAPTLEVRASDEDVRHFVAGQINRLPNCIRKDAPLQNLVQEKISEAVDGMFLLARLHVDSLLDKRTKNKVQSMLETMHGGFQSLNKAYDDCIERINNQLPDDAALGKRVLCWITYARRPLTTTELCYALAVEPNQEDLDDDNAYDIDDLVSVCAGLVTIDHERNIVRLVHYTTQEYLERVRNNWNTAAQVDFTSTCLTYLSFDTFKRSIYEDQQNYSWIAKHAFLGYAAQFWRQHAQDVQSEVTDLACSFLLDDASFSCATVVTGVLMPKFIPQNWTGLHFAARYGLHILLTELLSRIGGNTTTAINARDGDSRTPLSIAAQFGHENIAKVVLDHGAGIEAQAGRIALQTAAFYGHEGVVRVLLDWGADINRNYGFYGTALQAASYSGHEHMVLFLLDKGAAINSLSGEIGSALQIASLLGHLQVVKLLLSHGADIEAQSEDGSALQIASLRGHLQVVKLLLSHGADIEAQSEDGSALQIASVRGHLQVVKLLLSHGADIEAQSEDGSALHIATIHGYEQIVALLLGEGADVHAEHGKWGNALHIAALGGQEHIVRLLLERSADINSHSEEGGTALQVATIYGHKKVIELLLDSGADINARGGKHGTALQAAYHFHQEAVEQSSYESLETDSVEDYESIVGLLLERGADVNV
ncbi:ankyrin repeat domain-containing protein [Lophiotrema nucula]|uniref:Ankyrin repeat domain-containing protein n=1 Tax=Lophiotrema nucula TaxID=690887 RepID=A0A6A5ZNT4_9PLEO|nr:ankyrin repeat domain-containing protein [Lophiotrema nucula]